MEIELKLSTFLVLLGVLCLNVAIISSSKIEPFCSNNKFILLAPFKLFSGIKQTSVIYFNTNDTSPGEFIFAIEIGDVMCKASAKFEKVRENLFRAKINHGIPKYMEHKSASVSYAVSKVKDYLSQYRDKLPKTISAIPNVHICETSKPIYRPGEKIKARLVIIDGRKFFNLKEFTNMDCKNIKDKKRSAKSTTVRLKDPKKRVVKEWNLTNSENLDYELFLDAEEGAWHFSYGDDEEKMMRYEFKVQHYILPRYIITKKFIKVPTSKTVNDYQPIVRDMITLSVCSKYTNGLYMKGIVEGSVCLCSEFMQRRYPREIENTCKPKQMAKVHCKSFKSVLKQGCSKVSFNVSSWRTTNGDFDGKFESNFKLVEAGSLTEVEESLSAVPSKALANFITKTSPIIKGFPIYVSVKRPNSEKKYCLMLENREAISGTILFDLKEDIQEFTFPPIYRHATLSLIEIPNSDEYIVVEKKDLCVHRYSRTDMYVWPNSLKSPFVCPGINEFYLLSAHNLSGKTIYISSQYGGKNFEMEYLIEERKTCESRNDMFGHYKCRNDKIICMDGWVGPNCMERRCDCKSGCVCKMDGNCECNQMLANEDQPTEYQNLNRFYSYKLSLRLTTDHGPEFQASIYYINRKFKIVATELFIQKLFGCASEVNMLSKDVKKTGIYFDTAKILPGAQIGLNIGYRSMSNTKMDICYLQAYDEGMQKFFDPKMDFPFTIARYVSAWKRYLGLEPQGFYDSPTISSLSRSFLMQGCALVRYNLEFALDTQMPVSALPSYTTTQTTGLNRPKITLKPKIIEPPQLRQYFPESWIFSEFSMENFDANNKVKSLKINLTAPDTITKWQSHAYCITEKEGVYIPPKQATLTVEQLFHIELNIPKETKRGEIVHLPVTIFFESDALRRSNNYVHLKASFNEAEFVSISGKIVETCVGPISEDNAVIFALKAKKYGQLNITVTAEARINDSICELARSQNVNLEKFSDAIVKPMRVVPEGKKHEITQTQLACIKEDEVYKSTMSFKLPMINLVKDSLRAYAAVSGDIISVAASNLGNLVKKPYGCGEQNMITVSPSISVLQYLSKKKVQKGSAEYKTIEKIKLQAVEFIKTGYQRELNYKHSDGSFSAFGKSDKHGSTWLTAFVLNVFAEAKPLLPNFEMQSLFEDGLGFLNSVYHEVECFVEHGKLIHTEMLGDESNGRKAKNLSLSIHVLNALQIMGKSRVFVHSSQVDNLMELISKADRCINKRFLLNGVQISEIGKLTYAKLAYTANLMKYHGNHLGKLANKYKSELLSSSNEDDTGTMKWWGNKKAPKSILIQTTAYTFLATEKELDLSLKMRVIRWIIAQQSKSGGFYSTQDTIMGIKALSKFILTKLTDPGLVSSVKEGSLGINKEINVRVDEANIFKEYLVAEGKIPSNEDLNFDWQVKGIKSSGCLQLLTTIIYNTVENTDSSNGESLPIIAEYNVNQNAKSASSDCRKADMKFCIKPNIEHLDQTGMLLATVTIPTGYIIDKSKLPKLPNFEDSSSPMRHDIREEDGAVQFYFNGLSKDAPDEERCATLTFNQDVFVEQLNAAKLIVEDYYNLDIVIEKEFRLSDCSKTWVQVLDDNDNSDDEKCECFSVDDIKQTNMRDIIKNVCKNEKEYSIGFLRGDGSFDIRQKSLSSNSVEHKLVERFNKKCECSEATSENKVPVGIFKNIPKNGTLFYKMRYYINDFNSERIRRMMLEELANLKEACVLVSLLKK